MIDLSQLPAPNVIEPLDFESILAERKASLISYYPEAQQVSVASELERESDPRLKQLQESAYRELILRQRINDATRAVMLAYAEEHDLENLAAWLDVERLVVTPADPMAVPPVEAVYESDARFRTRIQLALDGFSCAGPRSAYKFFALSASAQVKDVSVDCQTAGIVRVVVLSNEASGVADTALLASVNEALNDEDVRPLCDAVEVVPAEIIDYSIEATLIFYPGPDQALILQAAEGALASYLDTPYPLGKDITRSGLYAALHRPGVQNVILKSPASDIVVELHQAAYCSSISIVSGGIDD